MTMALARSLVERGGLDVDHLGEAFARSWREEPWRGYGPGPPVVFASVEAGARWDEAARALYRGRGSYGNGAAMRVAPIGLVAYGDLTRVVTLARRSAQITHAHELGQQAAALQAAAVALLAVSPVGWGRSADELILALRPAAPDPAFQAQLDRLLALSASSAPEEVAETLGNGISGVEAVPAAIAAFLRHPGQFGPAVEYAVSLGGDTDTIASMTGALCGASLGAAAIPSQWTQRLEAADELVRLADRLLELSAAGGRRSVRRPRLPEPQTARASGEQADRTRRSSAWRSGSS
jgi:poly(ADP-ribose) glycohydrolase ARH3